MNWVEWSMIPILRWFLNQFKYLGEIWFIVQLLNQNIIISGLLLISLLLLLLLISLLLLLLLMTTL